jgi:hypothetical protein
MTTQGCNGSARLRLLHSLDSLISVITKCDIDSSFLLLLFDELRAPG